MIRFWKLADATWVNSAQVARLLPVQDTNGWSAHVMLSTSTTTYRLDGTYFAAKADCEFAIAKLADPVEYI